MFSMVMFAVFNCSWSVLALSLSSMGLCCSEGASLTPSVPSVRRAMGCATAAWELGEVSVSAMIETDCELDEGSVSMVVVLTLLVGEVSEDGEGVMGRTGEGELGGGGRALTGR